MKAKSKTKQDLLMEVKELRRLLDEAEQSRAKAILNEAEFVYLASFLQLNPNPIVEVDPAGLVQYSNPAADQLFPDLRKAGLDHPWFLDLKKVSETPEVNSVRPYVREVRLGNSWYQQRIHSVLEGTRLRIYGFDITERKRIEEALHEERDRLAALVHSIPDEVWFADPTGQFTLVNPSGSHEFGLNPGVITDIHQLAASLEVLRLDGTPRPIDEAPPLRALRGETVTNQEEIVRTPTTGESRYRQVSAAPVRDGSGNIVGSVSVVRDVTEFKRAEKAIRASEERLRRLIETSPVAIGFGDSAGKIFDANESFYRLTGYTRKEIKTREVGWNQLTAPEYAEIDRQIMTTLAATGSAGPYEKEYIRKDGSRVPLLLSVSKFPGRDEHIAFIVDITEPKRVERERERLRVEAENEKRRMEAVMEALPVGVALTDTRGGSIMTNKAYERVWGGPRPKAESVEDYEAYKAWWSDTGKPVAPEEWASAQAVQKGRAVTGQLMEIQRFDGSRASVINSGAPVFDADGKITGCAVAIQDITALRKAELALRESEARTTTILNSISDGFMTLNNELVVTDFNQAAEKLLGSKRGVVLGRNLFEAFPQARGSIFEERYSWAVKEKKATAFETYFGVEPYQNWYDVRVYPHEYGISVYFRVTTEKKKAQEALQRSKERFELLAETASKLLSTQNPQGIVDELCKKVMSYLDCHAFFNYLVDDDLQRLHLNAYAGIPEQSAKEIEWLDYGLALWGCADRDASQIVCENIPVTPDPRTELVKSFGIKAYACHPLIAVGRVIGTLSFGTSSRTAFTEVELSLMKTVADQVAIAMGGARLMEAVRRSRDELEMRVKERTADLARANELLEKVFSSVDICLAYMDRDFNFIRVNRAYAKVDEHDPDFYPGKNHFALFPNEENERIFKMVVNTFEPYSVYARPFEYAQHPERGVTYWDWNLQPVMDPDGSVGGLVLSLINVTERMRAQEAVRAERQRFLDVLETLPAYVVLLTPDYHANFANRVFRERFGESQGLRCFEFLFGLNEPCEGCETYTVLKTGAPHEWEWKGPDGRVYSVFDFPFVDTDGSSLILEMGIDVTDQKRAEDELKDREREIRHFATQSLNAQETERRRIAAELHDSIASALAGLKFKIEKTAEDMKRGLGNHESLRDLATNLAQTIGEVRRIMTDLRPSILDDLGILSALSFLCREFEATYSHICVEKRIGISEEQVPEALKIVIFRISQEALNNAAKHSDASRVQLYLQKAQDRVELTLQDNGQGFRPDEIVKGFGLSTMRERAELSGGTFSLESTQGGGTIIRASWPLAL